MITRKDKQYIELCRSASLIFSTCAKKKYAAILVDSVGHVVGMGYNGAPAGHDHCDDGGCPRLLDGSASGSQYDNCVAIHAEANALLHSDYSARPKKLYVNGPPCFSCAKLIANSTVQQLFYTKDLDYSDWPRVKKFLENSDILVFEVV